MMDEPPIYERHPYSAAWGDIPADDMRRIVTDMVDNGIASPVVWLYEEKILDGWHRYLASNLARLKRADLPHLDYRVFGGDPDQAVEFVIGLNLHRRHLTSAQLVDAVVRLHAAAGRPLAAVGNPRFPNSAPGAELEPVTTAEIAADAHVSERTVEQYRAGVAGGYGEQMRSGAMSAKAASEQARADKHPTKTERLESKADDLAMQLRSALDEVAALKEELALYKASAEPTALRDLAERARVAEMSAHDWQMKHAEERARANRLERQLNAFRREGG